MLFRSKMNVAGVKFLYGVTLDRAKVAERIPWPKVPHKQPDILSGTEVAKLLKAVSSLVPATALMTAYGALCRAGTRAGNLSKACCTRWSERTSRRCCWS